MGNKIGFEADNESVKLAYVQSDVDHIKFIQSLKSKYLRTQIKWSTSIIFLFECTIAEFLSYHTTQNVQLLRTEYKKLLNANQLIIRTNRATMNILTENKQLENAIKDILMKSFKLQHTQRIDNSVSAMHILTSNLHEFFEFTHTFSITQLHNFNHSFVEEKRYLKHLPEKFILIVLRNGIAAYRIERGKKIQRIDGSIIGEKTVLSILKFKYPQLSTQQCFELAFSKGDLKKVDLMVEDIYGTNSHNLGLPGNIVASSMGKLAKMTPSELESTNQADIIRSIINTFAINTANLMALYMQKTNTQDAIVLADKFHNDKFYCLLQSITASYAPGKSVHFANHASFMACLGTAFTNTNHFSHQA